MNKSFSLVVSFIATLSMFSADSVAHNHSHSKSESNGDHQGHSAAMVSHLIVREILPGAKSTAGYFTLMNHANKPIKLLEVSSEAFAKVEIHEHLMEDGMMSMQQVSKPIVIKPHQSVKFVPGGYHLMLFKPKQKIRKGTEVTLQFKFDGADAVVQKAKVISVLDQQKQSADDHSHHH